MTCAFHWREEIRPSIFATDRAFVPNQNGESASQVASRAVQEHEQRTGRSRGTVYGISKASDAAAEEFNHRVHLRNKGRAPGHYRG
jgi:hypothetical protein